MAAVGTVVGWQNWLCIFFVTSILGGIFGLIFALVRKRGKETLFNVAFIASELKSGRAAYLKKEELDVRSDKALRMPHGAVIAAGCILYLLLRPHVAA